jgi:hypothetical protein
MVALMNTTCHPALNATISQVDSLFNISLQKNSASGLFLGHWVPFLRPKKAKKVPLEPKKSGQEIRRCGE